MMQEYIEDLARKFKSLKGPIPPNVVGAIKRELETILDGYDFLGIVSKKHKDIVFSQVIDEARSMAELQGYDPNNVRLIPNIDFGYNHEGVCSVGVISWRYNIYSKQLHDLQHNQTLKTRQEAKLNYIFHALLPKQK